MATPHTKGRAARRVLLSASAWALWLGGWLVLAELGQRADPLGALGALPLVVWLAVVGWGVRWRWLSVVDGPVLRRGVCVSVVLTLACLCWAAQGGGLPAVLALAIAWAPLALFGARALLLADALMSRRGDATPRGILVPVCASVAVPGAAGWMHLGAAGAMVVMMANLSAMAQWCSTGWPASAMLGLHVAAMLAPAWLPAGCVQALRQPAGIAALLACGLALCALPAVNGWMVMSVVQAAAWGLLQVERPCRLPAPTGAWRPWHAVASLAPAATVLLSAMVLASCGPQALAWLQAGLGGLTLAGAVWAAKAQRVPRLAVASAPAK